MDAIERMVNDLIGDVLLYPDARDKIRERLKVYSAMEYVRFVSKENDCTIEEAQKVILNSPLLMKYMFLVS